ncbi:MAG: radical SAM protein [Chloroflexi bacterium]|nr:radical SAM protein [Chloroflexota bacterium]
MNKLKLLSQDMQVEQDGETGCSPIVNGKQLDTIPVSKLVMPNGKSLKVLKTMQTSACERDCFYCPFRAGRDMKRDTLKPDDLARLLMEMHFAKLVEGLFLSSGIIKGGVSTQDKLIDTAEILRTKYKYKGYIHLKIIPGAEKDQVERAMHLANRISSNLEAPNPARLQMLAPHKQFSNELLNPLIWAQEIRINQSPHKTWNGRWPSTTTQFVVGAVGENDLELLSTTDFLYRQPRLQRVYFSAFNPIADTPLDDQPATTPIREKRLYQSSFLIKNYGFSLEDLPFDESGNLPKSIDPKLAWARTNLQNEPVEINRASREQLLRVPGIGPKGANMIINTRGIGKLRTQLDLKKIGIHPRRAAPFILLEGKRPAFQHQML